MKFSITYPLIRTFLRAIQNSDPICLRFEGASIFQKFPNLNKLFKKNVSMEKWKIKPAKINNMLPKIKLPLAKFYQMNHLLMPSDQQLPTKHSKSRFSAI